MDSLGSASADAPSRGAIEPSTTPQIYGQGVRESSWQTPQQELKGFHLAPGFEARLFASEPTIAKPMNLAFDQQNRLWITQTVEYPFPAKDGSTPRDAVMILEDTDADGKADRATKFADALNIPIGILPYGDGCICFSVPNLLYLRDTDGDGVCDKREVILGPFDTTRDTHGMVNALRDGGDGWIYACHGFNNQSQVAGSDGHQITMHSGNTFRFRPDGSRVEHVTHGQVNPFGMTTDEWGYRYSADCHSKPVTQLIFGGCYPSFGRPHDGLGFVPPMVDHLHGSTAICGIVSYPSDSAIPALRGQLLSGNVMTSRINRNQVVFEGATAKGSERPDFMTSDDPWFRPVDLQVGPDSHLYVADFYNKIIGHYEVPLDHPDRDRDSGRIWQIRYTGNSLGETVRPKETVDLSIRDKRFDPSGSSLQIVQLQRQFGNQQVTAEQLANLVEQSSPQVSVAALRLCGEWIVQHPDDRSKLLSLVNAQLVSSSPHSVRMAAEILGQHGSADAIPPLLDRLNRVPDSDVVLRQSIRIAIRNLLQAAGPNEPVWKAAGSEALASICLGVQRPEIAEILLRYLEQTPDAANRSDLLSHAVKLTSPQQIELCVRVADKLTEGSEDQREGLMLEVLNAIDGDKIPDGLRDWIARHVQGRLAAVGDQERVVNWSVTGGGIWPPEIRRRRGGGELTIASSIGRGESFVGDRLSDPFAAPPSIVFWLAGHNGLPGEKDHRKNRAQLVRVADSAILYEAFPPRSDIATKVQWDLSDYVGEIVQIRIVDGDQASAYAWLGVGGFEPNWLEASQYTKWLHGSLDLILRVRLQETIEALDRLLVSGSLSDPLRFSIGQTVASLRNRRAEANLLQHASGLSLTRELTDQMLQPSFTVGDVDLDPIAQAVCQRLTQTQQIAFARSWASTGAPVGALLRFSEQGYLSPVVLAKQEVVQALEPRMDDSLRQRHQTLTHSLNVDQQLDDALRQLQQSVKLVNADLSSGKKVFTQHCANCHQLAGVGKVVGPQLDGVVTRTVERLLEDIVTPNRNVDRAFRTTSLLLDDGRVIAGLVINESGQELMVAGPAGRPIRVSLGEVVQRHDSGHSLMPSNFAELLKPDELRDLIGFVKATSASTSATR